MTLGMAAACGSIAFVYGSQRPFPPTESALLNKEEVHQLAVERKLSTSSKFVKRIPVFAHRGFSQGGDNVPDNSFEAFDLALSAGCPQIELDIRVSRDGVLYVSHDENLINTTGDAWEISQHDSQELDELSLPNGEKFHRLSEVLGRYRDQLIYLLEFKDTVKSAQPFLDLMRQYANYSENVQIQSFDPTILEEVHNSLPNMFVQLLVGPQNKELLDQALSADWLDSISTEKSLTDQALIDRAHNAGKEIWVWTVDDLGEIHQFLKLGVNGVISDLESAVAIYKEETGQHS